MSYRWVTARMKTDLPMAASKVEMKHLKVSVKNVRSGSPTLRPRSVDKPAKPKLFVVVVDQKGKLRVKEVAS